MAMMLIFVVMASSAPFACWTNADGQNAFRPGHRYAFVPSTALASAFRLNDRRRRTTISFSRVGLAAVLPLFDRQVAAGVFPSMINIWSESEDAIPTFANLFLTFFFIGRQIEIANRAVSARLCIITIGTPFSEYFRGL